MAESLERAEGAVPEAANGGRRGGRLRTAYGLEATVHSSEALRLYDLAVREALEFGAGALGSFERATELDPGFALAWAGLGMSRFMAERFEAAREAAARAEALAPDLSGWERRHVAALARFVEGKTGEATALMREALREEPRDILLFLRLFFVEFWRGRSPAMLELSSGLIDHYPGDSLALGLHAFALEEMGRYRPALELGEAAIRLNPRNGWAVHAVAHVHYEQGSHREGAAFLPPALARCDHLGYFRTHLLWHLALFELSAGRYRSVAQLYREGIRARRFEMPAELHDATSLLWRERLYGRDPEPELWRELASIACERAERPNMLFHHLHLTFALAAAGDEAALGRQRAFLQQQAARTNGSTVGEVGIPLLDGIAAYAGGDYQAAARQIGPVEERIVEVGGSHAQREVFHETLIEALLRIGEMGEAERRLRARLEHRPEAARHWYRLGRSQAARGDSAAARESLQRVLRYWQDADPDAPERVGAQELLTTLA